MDAEPNVLFSPALWQQRLDKVMELVVKFRLKQVSLT
jgi:hypothetical protein